MNTITNSFQTIIDTQKNIGYYFPSILQQPADKKLITEAEQKLNLNFSSELKELYSFANGTARDSNPLGMVGLIPIYLFMDLKDATDYYHTMIQYEDQFKIWDTGFKPGIKLFPFLEDSSGNCYWVDLNIHTEHYGKIFWTNTYPDSPAYTFNSLTSMFETISQAYQRGVFFLDKDGYLSEDYDKWGETAKEYNPGIKFWDDYINGT